MIQHAFQKLGLGLLIAAGLGAGSIVPATARTSGPDLGDSVRPRIMDQAVRQSLSGAHHQVATATASTTAPQVPQAAVQTSSLRREVFGYVNAGNLSDPNVGYTTWNYQDLSTIAYFGLDIAGNGSIINDSNLTTWNSANLTAMVSKAHSAGVKVVVSLIQHSSDGSLCQALSSSSISATVAAVGAQVQQKGVDGVNLDYEGPDPHCSTSSQATGQDQLAAGFRSWLNSNTPSQNNLTIATYASSAQYPGGFFDIPGLAKSVDRFFVMAYDMDGGYSSGNWQGPPLNCSSYCFSPTAPLTTYNWNDTRAAQTYLSVVPASQVILGVPYYGYTACVAALSASRPGPNATAYPASTASWTAPTYLDSTTTNGYTGVSNWAEGRDPHDTAGNEPFSTWQSSSANYNCWRESYWDDTASLAAKYELVNGQNLAGVGLFALDYGGGASELWYDLSSHFACPSASDVASNPGGTWWQGMPGSAKDVGASSNCSANVIGSNAVPGGYGVYGWAGTGWGGYATGGGVRIATGPDGTPWVVNAYNQIYHWSGGAWQHVPGSALDISIGADGSIWVIGTNSVSGGYGIWESGGSGWHQVPGGGVRIAAVSAAGAWVVNSAGDIYQFAGGWSHVSGSAHDIGAGGGAVWVTGADAVPGGYGIWRWTGSGWVSAPGGGVSISVDPIGLPWIVNSTGGIYERL